mgnify:FL=1
MKLYKYILLKKGLKDLLAVYFWRKPVVDEMVRCGLFSYFGRVPKGMRKGLMAVLETDEGANMIPVLQEQIRKDVKFWLELPALIVAAAAAVAAIYKFLIPPIIAFLHSIL